MAISAMYSSKKSPVCSPSQKKALEIKKKVLKKRALVRGKTNKVENGDTEKIQICTQKKTYKTSSVDANSAAMLRAEEVQANLPSQFPSFVKYMLPSHVTGGFWLGFPKKFCASYLPKRDDTAVLVDEDGKEYATKYLVEKNGLSGGWRGFSIAHSLLEGDVLVFQLIQACKFKVYIVRANSLTEIDGAISLLNLDFHARPIKSGIVTSTCFNTSMIINMYSLNFNQKWTPFFLLIFIHIDQDEDMKICEAKEETFLEPSALDIHQDDKREVILISDSDHGSSALDIHQDDRQEVILISDSDHDTATEHCGNDSDNGSEVLEGIRFSESKIDFKDVKDFSGFNILVDSLIIDSEIPAHIRTKYYELCRTQNSFLHDHLFGGLNCKLAAGMITETVNIADAIRASKISIPREYLETWDNTLKGFECLGMEVGFLRARLNKLVSMSSESKQILETKRNELAEAKEELKNLEAKLLNVKQVIKNLDSEIESLTGKDKNFEINFKALAASPW